MSEDKEAFLDRWSRLKQERPAEQPSEKPVVPEVREEPAPPLQPVEELKPDSDFTPFMDPRVDGATRRAALKKLFADAHYNVPDAFEAYSGDWTTGEPIPMEMLKTLNHARKLLFDEADTAQAPSSKTVQAPTEEPETPPPEAKDVDGKQDA